MIALAQSGAEDGLWLRAERQTAGRGRMGRSWDSPSGNLYVSHLVRLRATDPAAPSLAFVAAVAVEETLRHFAPDTSFQIKWPNDVMALISPSPAKLSGLLLERAGDAVVIGMGVNLANHPLGLDRPVTSLAALGVAVPDAAAFLDELAARFAHWLGQWRGAGLPAIREAWFARAHPEATPLSVTEPGGSRTDGVFAGLDPDCALRLRLADGSVRVIHAGDVFFTDRME